jgi:acetyltransferase
MISELRYQAMLDGARGAPKVDRQKLAELLLAVSQLAMAHSEITEIDLNPVIANADGYAIVDARMVLAAE